MALKYLNELTLPELKQLLTKRGLPVEGNKPDCLIRLEESFRSEGKDPLSIQVSVTEREKTPAQPPSMEGAATNVPEEDVRVPTRQEDSSLLIAAGQLARLVDTISQQLQHLTTTLNSERESRFSLAPRTPTLEEPNTQSTPVEAPEPAPQGPLSGATLFELELPTFEGNEWEDPLLYTEGLERVLKKYKVPSGCWTAIGTRELRGIAARWWGQQRLIGLPTWETFRQQLLTRFNNPILLAKLKAEYFSVQQGNEKVQDFLLRKHSLFRRLFPGTTDREFRVHVTELVDPALRGILRQVVHRTTDEFIASAALLEQDQQEINRRSHGRNTMRETGRTPPGQRQHPREERLQQLIKVEKAAEVEVSPSIRVEINGTSTIAKVDTQASTSFIHPSLADEIGVPPEETERIQVQMGVDKFTAESMGEVTAPIEINGITQEVSATILENLSDPLILGNDWLSREQAVVDYESRAIILGQNPRRRIPWANSGMAAANNLELSIREEQLGASLMDSEREALRKVLGNYKERFQGLGKTRSITHKIVLEDATPIRIPAYKYSEEKGRVLEAQTKEMETQGIIRPSTSPYASPVVLVRKPDATWRMCVDYRQLNQVTTTDAYTMPNLQEKLRCFAGSKYFTLLDLRSGYWQIEMEEKSKQYTAFSTPMGLYEFNVMPFGLKNSPMTFQRLMEEVGRGYLGRFTEIYLDDIIIHSTTFEEHLTHLTKILDRLTMYGLTCHQDKCSFAQEKIKFLGHIVGVNGIEANPEKLRTVQEFPEPTSKKQVQQFLGLCQWFGNFIQDMAAATHPLYETIKAKRRWFWGEEQKKAFQELKKKLLETPRLAHFQPDQELFLQTDASEVGLGAVLFQTEDGTPKGPKRILAFGSRQLQGPETRQTALEREALAVIWAIQKYRGYLDGRTFTLITDNQALTWMRKTKDTNSKVHRWFLLLMGYDFKLHHCPGQANQAADALSRNPNPIDLTWKPDESHISPEVGDVQPMRPTLKGLWAQVKTQQGTDPVIQKTKQYLKERNPGPDYPYETFEDTLYFHHPLKQARIVIPSPLIPEVIAEYHDRRDHPGYQATLKGISERAYWRGMGKQVREYVRKCDTCNRTKPNNHPIKDTLTHRTPQIPFETLAVDLMGPYPRSKTGKTHLLVVTDLYSRWVEAFPIASPTSGKILKILEGEVCLRFGYPARIISDNGRQFTSKEWTGKLAQWGTQPFTTPVYLPRANPTERRNQEIKKCIRARLLQKKHTAWDEDIGNILFNLRSRVNEAMGTRPIDRVLIYEPNRPGDWELPQPHDRKPEGENHGPFKEGGKVFIKTHLLSRATERVCGGLGPKWKGPFTITRRLTPNIYIVSGKNKQRIKIHSRDMKPCPPTTTTNQLPHISSPYKKEERRSSTSLPNSQDDGEQPLPEGPSPNEEELRGCGENQEESKTPGTRTGANEATSHPPD